VTRAELRQAAKDRRSIKWRDGYGNTRPSPAAWVLNMSWSIVESRLPDLELYEPKKRDDRPRCDWCRKKRRKLTAVEDPFTTPGSHLDLCDDCLVEHAHECDLQREDAEMPF